MLKEGQTSCTLSVWLYICVTVNVIVSLNIFEVFHELLIVPLAFLLKVRKAFFCNLSPNALELQQTVDPDWIRGCC